MNLIKTLCKLGKTSLVLAILLSMNTVILAADSPSSWAADGVTQAIEAQILPESLQNNYTAPATRAEFCALATAQAATVSRPMTV